MKNIFLAAIALVVVVLVPALLADRPAANFAGSVIVDSFGK